ncbi:UNVERIFIED_CONTAM: hypothetical protein NCL1_55183 [Trichonephila clavipes]
MALDLWLEKKDLAFENLPHLFRNSSPFYLKEAQNLKTLEWSPMQFEAGYQRARLFCKCVFVFHVNHRICLCIMCFFF